MVAEWEHDNEKFFATSAFKTIIELVKKTSFVVITGSSGMGKSAIAYHTALLFRDLMEYEILIINEPKDILKLCDSSQKQIVIVDDICGKFAVDEGIVQSWERYQKKIMPVIKKAKDSLRIVATCRLHLRESKLFKRLMKAFEIKECNLLSDELALDLSERREIGLCYLNEEQIDMLEEEVIAKTQMFPLLCKLSSKKSFNPDFFRNPYEIVKEELNEFASKNEECFFGLALLVLFNNDLQKCLFHERNDILFNEIFDEVFEELEMSGKPSKLAVLNSLETLKGTFVKGNACSISAIHDKVFDYIAFFIGQMLLKTILKYGDSRFIYERMNFEILNELSDSEFVIMIDKDHEEMFYRRIGEEIRNRKFYFILCTDISETEYYQQNVISLLSEQDDLLSIFTGNFWALVFSALNPCDMLYTFAKERVKKLDCNQTSDAESKQEGFKTSVVCDTQMSFDYQYHRNTDANNDDTDDDDEDDLGDFYFKSSNGPLLLAIKEGREDVVNLLMESGNAININKTIALPNSKCTPLKFALDSDEPDIAKILIANKADVNVLYEGNCTLLHIACTVGNTDFLEILLGSGECDFNMRNNLGETPLFLACANSETECVEFLVASQCDINTSNNDGQSPLHLACSEQNVNIVNILLNTNYCDFDHCDNIKNTALTISCERGNTEIANLLILHGCRINASNVNGMTALHIATAMGYCELAKLLILHYCDINVCDTHYQTPLHLAIENYKQMCIELLISQCCDVKICNLDGQSSLHIACKNGQLDTVDLLLKTKYCDLDQSDNNEDSPLAVACAHGCEAIVNRLSRKGCNLDKVNIYGLSPLHIAVGGGYIKIAETLIQNGCNINLCDANNQTPLFHACEMGINEAVELLLNKGSDANICNSDGVSPLDIANFKEFSGIVTYISNKTEANMIEIIYSRI